MIGLAAAVVIVLLTVSALLTASYEAVSKVGRSHVRTLQDEGFDGSEALATLRESEAHTRVSVRLATTLCDLTSVGIIAHTGVPTFGTTNAILSTALGIGFVVLVADLIPHAFAARFPVRLALNTAPVLLSVTRVTGPFADRVARLQEGSDDDEARSTERRDLEAIQKIGEEEGVLEESENLLVERAFRLDELTAWDVMIPRVDIFAWREGLTLAEIVDELEDVPYSRVPVYRESIDDVTGLVYVREAYERIARGERGATLGSFAREPFFVPGSLPLTQLLHDFQVRRIHLGIVADEFGGTDGLVTMEDVLEELVGEIRDETDRDEETALTVVGDSVECPAAVDVREVEEALGVPLPDVDHRSLNGLILEVLGQVPPEGETFQRTGVRFEILEATETQVLRVRLTRVPEGQHNGDES